MLDLEKMLQRIQNLTSEEWNRIMKESLDAAHIEYSETPGEVIFNGFSPELFHYPCQVKFNNTAAEIKPVTSYCQFTNAGYGISVNVSAFTETRFILQNAAAAA